MGRAVLVAVLLGTALVPAAAIALDQSPKIFEQIDTLDRFADDARAALGAGRVPEWPKTCPEGGTATTWCDPTSFIGFQDTSGTILVVPSARQLWQFYTPGGTGTGVVVRDLDALDVIKKSMILPGAVKRTGGSGPSNGDWAHAIDEVHNRLFLFAGQSSIYEIDLKTFNIKTRALPTTGVSLGGETYDPYRDDLLLLYSGPGSSSVVNSQVFLYQLDLSAEQNATTDVTKLVKIQSCTGPVTSTDVGSTTADWEILVAEDYLWVPCQRAGHVGIVVRMRPPSAENPFPQEDYIAGPNYATLALADQQAQRIFMISSQGEIWAFDAPTLSFLGVVATVDGAVQQGDNPGSGETAWGLDPATGRFFYQNDRTGLGVVEGRFFPVPQALIDRSRKVRGTNRIYSDAATNRVFVLEGDWAFRRPRHYKIYRVFPAPKPPPPPNPDLSTVDMEEKAGVTESSFFSRGSGYGFRALWAGGWEKVVPAPPAGVLCWTCPVNQGFGNGRSGSVDREYYLGRVFNAEYDTGSTSASAIGAGMDSYSRQAPSSGNPVAFNYSGQTASCTSSEGGEPQSATGQSASLGPSSVHCPLPGGELRAYAEGRAQEGVSVGKAWTETTITRLNRAVLSQTTAVAQDIIVAGVIHIGEVRSQATSLANGRPARQDMSTHTVAIKGVRIGDNLVCNQCTDTEAVMRALTTAGGPLRMQFRTGTQDTSGLDLALKRGSPRGALTAIQKSEARQAQDRSLVGDSTPDVPGLEITVFNDNVVWGRARQIYQFAGVSTVANYNIVVLPTGSEFTDDTGDEDNSDFYGTEDQSPQDGSLDSLFAQAGDNTGPEATGNFIVRAIKRVAGAVAKGMRLFLTNPRQFLLLLTAWGLFSLPPILSRRRRLLGIARSA